MTVEVILIYCANCGSTIDYGKHWHNLAVRAPVCGKKCNDELSIKYYKMMVARNNSVKSSGG
jgi:hypothetical protein